jgi:hypothetical protein
MPTIDDIAAEYVERGLDPLREALSQPETAG